MNCLFISNVRFLGTSAVDEVDVCDKMMLRNNYKLRTKLTGNKSIILDIIMLANMYYYDKIMLTN